MYVTIQARELLPRVFTLAQSLAALSGIFSVTLSLGSPSLFRLRSQPLTDIFPCESPDFPLIFKCLHIKISDHPLALQDREIKVPRLSKQFKI